MNKIVIALATLFVVCSANDYPSMFGNMRTDCVNKVIQQIGCEVRASLEYLKMGAHFSQDNINRPGFTKFFFDSASEEREHAIKLIEYLNMRGAHAPGDQISKVTQLDTFTELLEHSRNCPIFKGILCTEITDGVNGLECALNMEIAVTKHINELIRVCEEESKASGADSCVSANVNNRNVKCNDYHFVDYLTGEFLQEQYEGQRKIAGSLKTLQKLKESHGNIGEFMFDKTLME